MHHGHHAAIRPPTFAMAVTSAYYNLAVALSMALFIALPLSAHAQLFSDLFVFGDSLSDVGNTRAATSSTLFFVYPGSSYYQGRFSDGPVYSELLSQQLELGTLTRSSAGGDNFAYGGAKTSGTSGISGAFINDLGEQVDDYTTNRTGDPNALYIVWAGANDLFDGQLNMSIPVGNITGDIAQLYGDGARQFLVMNLPKLGATPAYNGTAASRADWNNRSLAFNSELNAGLTGLENSLAQISIERFDVAALFDQVLATPADLGLTNVTSPAAPGLEPGDWFYNSGNVVANPEEYLFWDEVHPTTTMHAALADAIYDFLTAPDILAGDYNNDGLVNLADFTVWRANLGSTASLANDDTPGVGPDDYAVWKSQFANSAGTVEVASQPIPEPRAIDLLALTILIAVTSPASVRR